MSASERRQSPLFVKTQDFIVWLFQHTAKFPRQYRHTLTERIENGMLEFQRALGAVLILKDNAGFERADFELWHVRQLLRIAQALHLLPAGLQQHVVEQTEEIGRLLGAWKKKALET